MSRRFPNSPIIILDQDWAPDFVINEIGQLLETGKIKTTWFMTHPSPALEKFNAKPDLIELGIHPNFLPASTHGETTQEVMDHCLSFLPNSITMRTHAYAQSSVLYSYVANNTNIAIDASVFIPHTPHLAPFQYWIGKRSLLRMPIFWEDDNEMKIPDFSWDINHQELGEPGLKIFAFHPIHIYLNTAEMEIYHQLKREIPDIQHASIKSLEKFIQTEKRGVRDFFLDLLQIIGEQDRSFTIREIIPTNEDQ